MNARKVNNAKTSKDSSNNGFSKNMLRLSQTPNKSLPEKFSTEKQEKLNKSSLKYFRPVEKSTDLANQRVSQELKSSSIDNKSTVDGGKSTQFYTKQMNFNHEDTNENIKVCLRVRPLNTNEINRNKNSCVEILNNLEVNYKSGKLNKKYQLDYIFDQKSTQEDIFHICALPNLIESVIEGYSVTVFAYGQTGSGKSYSIMGKEDVINQNVLHNEFAGLIPNTIKHIWKTLSSENKPNTKTFIKASFCEIYNESINDLLSPASKNLPIRFSNNQGFFVEGLLVIDCITSLDVVEIILEGNRNRKVGSHNLNTDSSRSHSLLTLYIITEDSESGLKKYGKITFVDLAGSERLKESGSSGEMAKETGNINKSLFVLGKVISCLADKKASKQHIPYRDSKLTMLLMDSIGGSSKTLMIACISPSLEWAEETLSTLNYASKSMNITNRPTVQVESEDRQLANLTKENEMLKEENEAIKNVFIDLYGSYPLAERGDAVDDNGNALGDKENDWGAGEGFSFPELEAEKTSLLEDSKKLTKLKEYEDMKTLKLMEENQKLSNKLKNLEMVLIGPSRIQEMNKAANSASSDLNISRLTQENLNLRKKLSKVEYEKTELKNSIASLENPGTLMKNNDEELLQLTDQNRKLNKRVEFLQKRERELLQTLMQLKSNKAG